MDILHRIEKTARTDPGRLVFVCDDQKMTYGQLWERSGRLARYLGEKGGGGPLPVWGHKSPWMLVCFVAAARAGLGYCPLDTSIPWQRAASILENLPEGVLLATESVPGEAGREVLSLSEMEKICERELPVREEELSPVRGEDIFYVIFTSGSTGTPKGVTISESNLGHFLDWSTSLVGKEGGVYLNQAPFSFDLSVMDLYTCLASGGTLWCLTKKVQGSYKELMESLGASGATVWVSTPSFALMALADPSFGRELMKDLECFLFCGETLPAKTVARLWKAFPGARIYNTYGPTESTVAVTGVLLEEGLPATGEALPVGRAKPGTLIEIWDEDGRVLPEGERGEVIILGDTVSAGYLGREDLNAKAFFTREGLRGYHTGDEGYLRDGMLYYVGRLDLQVKLHGYRIELGDIEAALASLPGVRQAVVLPRRRGGAISSLTGLVVLEEGSGARPEMEALREALREKLPEYMVPKKLEPIGEIPMTRNGKADRKALEALL